MKYVKVLDIPDEKNVYIIGDIHGNFELFQKTLHELGITDDDVLISVGDLVDRGRNNSKMLFEFLNKENRYMVLGNHEDMMMRGRTSREWYFNWLQNGGQTTLDEIGSPGINHFCTLLEDVPHIIEVNHRGYKLGIAHAGIPNYPNVSDWETIKKWTEEHGDYRHQLLWDRDAIQMARYDFELPDNEKLERIISGVDYVIHGHTGVPHKFAFGNRVWIDTQFRSGQFTIATIDDDHLMKYYTVVPDEWGAEVGYEIKETK
ncbi:Serine/threonine protein phosphatase [Yersinia phage fHe-Yen9-04]|uniref:Serine/threonine protein phosphatase n=1 Tax=Yersinia phage fHe-Yen9-04 TaxID=2052742 RepID=A0A2C9CWH4_9CAUD|nr:NinI-like serine-threonine phosphatase [Yersinia phage fHe-Yen9-04]SOK58354.1 Serine/threonine protein phosphatase [Yersinia phage fHe-Yen9-04]VUE36123.1 Serine/threonine protein phosphatase [Yersinia phage fHe-Yen9-04]